MVVLSGHGRAAAGRARGCELAASGGRKAVEAGTALWRHSACCSPARLPGILIGKLNATCWKDLASTAVTKHVSNWAVAWSRVCMCQIRFSCVVESMCWVPASENPTKNRAGSELFVKVVPKGRFPLVLPLRLLSLLPPARVLGTAAECAFPYPTSRLSCVLGRSNFSLGKAAALIALLSPEGWLLLGTVDNK